MYAEIATGKLLQEEANSKIGDVWVSFFLNEAVTIRDNDWAELSANYFIPEPIEKIDHLRIVHKKKSLPKACVSAMNANQNIMPLFPK